MTKTRHQTDVKADPLAILQAARVFRHLPIDAQRRLAATARIERCDARRLIVSRTAPPEHIRYIVEGAVELLLTSPNGREARLPPMRKGEWATWVSCFADAERSHDLWAAPSSIFVAFPAAAVCAAVRKNPDALMEVIQLIGSRMRALIAWNLNAYLASDEQRLGGLILHFSQAAPSDRRVLIANVTQEQFAQFGFGSRQRVARLLKRLECRGFIELGYGHISICSAERLREFVIG